MGSADHSNPEGNESQTPSIPRKGTETCNTSSRFQKLNASDTLNSPQGDGNAAEEAKQIEEKYRQTPSIPRKGTET